MKMRTACRAILQLPGVLRGHCAVSAMYRQLAGSHSPPQIGKLSTIVCLELFGALGLTSPDPEFLPPPENLPPASGGGGWFAKWHGVGWMTVTMVRSTAKKAVGGLRARKGINVRTATHFVLALARARATLLEKGHDISLSTLENIACKIGCQRMEKFRGDISAAYAEPASPGCAPRMPSSRSLLAHPGPVQEEEEQQQGALLHHEINDRVEVLWDDGWAKGEIVQVEQELGRSGERSGRVLYGVQYDVEPDTQYPLICSSVQLIRKCT